MMQLGHRHHGTCRTMAAQQLGVNLIKGRPVLHTDNVNRHFEQITRLAARRLENGQQVIQRNLCLLSKRRFQVVSARGAYRQLPRDYSVPWWLIACE